VRVVIGISYGWWIGDVVECGLMSGLRYMALRQRAVALDSGLLSAEVWKMERACCTIVKRSAEDVTGI